MPNFLQIHSWDADRRTDHRHAGSLIDVRAGSTLPDCLVSVTVCVSIEVSSAPCTLAFLSCTVRESLRETEREGERGRETEREEESENEIKTVIEMERDGERWRERERESERERERARESARGREGEGDRAAWGL